MPIKNKKVLLQIIIICIFFIFTCKQEKKQRIAFIGYSSTEPYWIGLKDAAIEQAELMDIKFTDLTPSSPNAGVQKQAMENAINQKVDGIIIGAIDNTIFHDTLDKAQKNNIPVIAVDNAINHPWIASLIQTDNLSAAKFISRYIIENIHAYRKIFIMGGTKDHQTGNARISELQKIAESANLETIVKYCNWQEDIAIQIFTEELENDNKIGAIFSITDQIALSAIQAVKETNQLNQVLIIGFDGNPANLKAIKNGDQHADFKQNNIKIGSESVINLLKVINGEKIPKYVPVPGTLITIDNVNQFL